MNQSEFLSAHTAWLRADLMRRHLYDTDLNMNPVEYDGSILTKEPIIYMFLWHALLFVVVEFMHTKRAIPPIIQSDVDSVYDSLKKLRHAVFHAQNEFISPKLVLLGNIPNYIQVINKIHSELGSFLCDGGNRPKY